MCLGNENPPKLTLLDMVRFILLLDNSGSLVAVLKTSQQCAQMAKRINVTLANRTGEVSISLFPALVRPYLEWCRQVKELENQTFKKQTKEPRL